MFQCTAPGCDSVTDSHYCTACRLECIDCRGEYGPGELFAGKCDTCRRADEAEDDGESAPMSGETRAWTVA